MKLIDYQPPKAERRTDAPFTFPNQRSSLAAGIQRTNRDAGRRTPGSLPTVECGIYSEAEPGGPVKARQSMDMEGSAMHQPGESPGTYIKPRHLLIASLCCWTVVMILIGVVTLR